MVSILFAMVGLTIGIMVEHFIMTPPADAFEVTMPKSAKYSCQEIK